MNRKMILKAVPATLEKAAKAIKVFKAAEPAEAAEVNKAMHR